MENIMNTSDFFPTQYSFTLPEQVNKFVEDAIEGLEPLKMEDYYRSRLKEEAWNLYQEELKNGFSQDQAEAQTIKELGNIKDIRTQIQKELEYQKKRENSVLWKVPMTATIFFSVVACISLISCILYGIRGNQLFHILFPTGVSEREINGVTGVTVYGKLIGSSYLWLFTSLLFIAVCLCLTIHLKKKYKL